MDKITKKTLNKKLIIPFVVALIGVLVIVVGMFLPYMTATGEMGEFLESYPEKSIIIEDYNMTASDLKDIPMISVSKVAESAYNEEEAILFKAIVLAFGFFLILTTLFIILKKPIPIIIFVLLSCGVFVFHIFATNLDFIDDNKYAWGIGCYITMAALAIIFIGAIWMLVKKIIVKKKLNAEVLIQTE